MRDRIADRRRAHADDRRILGSVDDFVNLPRLEAAGQIHASAVQFPFALRDEAARPFDRVAHGERVGGIVRVGDRVGDVIAIGERRVERHLRDNHLAADDAHDRLAVVCGDGRIDADEALALRRIELPADPEQREALLHQEAVAHLCFGRRIEAARRLVVEAEHPFAAAVRDLVQHGAVAAFDLFRLDQKEVRRELHAPARVSRRLVDVGDDLVRREGRDRPRSRCGPPASRTARWRRTASRRPHRPGTVTSIRTTSAAAGDQVTDTNRIAARIRLSMADRILLIQHAGTETPGKEASVRKIRNGVPGCRIFLS